MTAIHTTHAEPLAPPAPAPAAHTQPAPALITLLAAGAALSVAALYYAQPMLGLMATDLGADQAAIGWLPTLTQLGYALGILLLAPLGDRHDRRRIILVKAAMLTIALLAAALAPSLGLLWLVSAAIGLTATLAQDIVPAAAALSPEATRGQVVGKVMTGLLLGILLSRVVSGYVGEHFGWRSMYGVAAVAMAGVGVAAWRGLPSFTPTTALPYRALLGSLLALLRQHPTLRQAALAQGLLSMGFSAFWSTLAIMLHGTPFHLGSTVAGAFGIAGAAGALAAPLAGKLADRKGPGVVTQVGATLSTLSFVGMSLATLLPASAQLPVLALCTVGFDLGVQAALIAHQTLIYGIDPAARSRLNAVLIASMFIGMASGAALGSLALVHWGWLGVTLMATASAAAALTVRRMRVA